MTNKQLKQALLNQCPVDYKGITYKCVSAIIYRNIKGKIKTFAELTDRKNNNSVVIVEAWYIEEVK